MAFKVKRVLQLIDKIAVEKRDEVVTSILTRIKSHARREYLYTDNYFSEKAQALLIIVDLIRLNPAFKVKQFGLEELRKIVTLYPTHYLTGECLQTSVESFYKNGLTLTQGTKESYNIISKLTGRDPQE